MASEQFSLCWDNFHKNMSSGMNSLLENEDLVDVTLAVQGKCLKAHKMVLSVCSPYFKELFKSNPCQHPIVFMKDVSYEALSDLLQFMYQGEVQVSQENLSTFIKTAEALQIKGLTGDGNGSTDNDVTEVPVEKHTPHVEEYKPIPVSRPKKQQLSSAPPTSSPSVKRQRLSSNDAQSIPQTITKVEPVAPSHQSINVSTPEPAAVHFKMEPYDQSQNLLDETGDENFGDDTLDENVGDDTEDYSMMETGTGGPEEEPQAGTSTDGAGEGQGTIYIGAGTKNPKIILDENEFTINTKQGARTRWRCTQYFKSKCRASLVSYGKMVKVNQFHNHTPTKPSKQNLLPQIVTILRNRRVVIK
ncbi:modifier of mdg4-like isoform X33 [Diorhabda carinulata]|uniref:modifier of mdg4-like isoform X31 n=1 Tax=Diorhabda sublineata TaxID=1163346 RepID=UPI0024E13A7D|nr:modifier of mdg4-like isoform X31 [Diorhabda sublineata]XP_057667871.1 modifier of mdg4-like isoform X33 [Diorhabda carinulata]